MSKKFYMKGFTDGANKVVNSAMDEAFKRKHDFLGSEHLLLGILNDKEDHSIKMLKKMGLSIEKIRMEIERNIMDIIGIETIEDIPFTPRVKKALELAVEEARLFGHNFIGSEHILLGLIREEECIAGKVLRSLGANLSEARKIVLRIFSGAPLSIYFDLSTFNEHDIAGFIGLLSDTYRSLGGDSLIIKQTFFFDTSNVFDVVKV